MTGEGDYVYDVFVSYRREPPGEELLTPWLMEVVKRVRRWLGMCLGGVEARVFFDTQVLGPGSRWQTELGRAIRTSKCLLPIWSPEYFNSQWCVAEWQSFVDREQLLDPPARLIVPITIHDGQSFPPEAQQVTHLDLCGYAGTTGGFWETRRAGELDIMLYDFSPRLADIVRNAPPYRPDWPVRTPPSDPPEPPRNVPMRRL